MPNKKKYDENHQMQKKHAAEESSARLTEANKLKRQYAMMHSQKRERELAPFKDFEKSKKLKEDNAGLQMLLDGFVTAISPIAPAISQVLLLQRKVLNNTQTSSLIDIGKTFAELPFAIADPNRSMKQNLDMFIGGMKKLTSFVAENPEIIAGVATILFPALLPISGFLTETLKFLLSATLVPALKEPLVRAAKSAKNEVDHAESAIRDASKHVQKLHNPGIHQRSQS
jgi:hypothetical protein